MVDNSYLIKQEGELVFSFISKGPKGEIEKLIKYKPIFGGFFNLGVGDRVGNTLFFNDKVTTDNQDTRKVLTTVVKTFPLFFAKNPNPIVHFKGSDTRRTRFYGWIIENYLEEFSSDYFIFGATGDKVELFEKNRMYEYFLIRKK